MIICPVCEHQQAQGAVCDNCGKQLVAVPAPPAFAAPMPELELTSLPGGNPAIPVQPIPDLELTRQRTGPDLPVQPVPELERHQAPAIRGMQVERMADIDLGRAQDDGVRTAAPVGAVTCRYCRNVQAAGLFCDHCGMRLPKVQAAKPQASAPSDTSLVICGCGAKAIIGRRCGSCGARTVAPE